MPLLRKLGLLALIVMVLPGFGSGQRIFAPGADLWPRWQAHDPGSRTEIDHGVWDALLARYRSEDAQGVARLDYARFAGEDRAALSAYIATLSGQAVSRLARDEQMAFWINLYNALTVGVILDHHPVASIRDIDISPGLFADGPWDKALIEIEGQALTLNDIEHRILRPIWRDARIHYALNCASIGCPNLAATAWRAATLETHLDGAARAYVNSSRGVAVQGRTVTVSRIYDWFIEDFGGTEAGVIAHLRQFADDALAAELARIGELTDTAYDWSLNDVR